MPAPRRSRRSPAPTRWSSWAAGRRRRPGCCWTRCVTAEHCAGSCRSTSTRACCRRPSKAIQGEYPGIEIAAVCGDFEEHLAKIPNGGRRLFVFLGSTIGNLQPGARAEFLAGLAAALQPGDSLLLGTDLVKDTGRLVAAYDDAAGVTAQFNRNVLAVINRELDADFDVDAFRHVATWNAVEERMEMWLRSERRAARPHRGAEPDRRLRRRRTGAHRGVVQIPGRGRGRRTGAARACGSPSGGPTPPVISGCRCRSSERRPGRGLAGRPSAGRRAAPGQCRVLAAELRRASTRLPSMRGTKPRSAATSRPRRPQPVLDAGRAAVAALTGMPDARGRVHHRVAACAGSVAVQLAGRRPDAGLPSRRVRTQPGA